MASNNPEDEPLINPNYLAEDADVTYLVNGKRCYSNPTVVIKGGHQMRSSRVVIKDVH